MDSFAVTPSFEPKRGKFMAYNRNKEIVIVDTSSWEVKKKLSDENVGSVGISRHFYLLHWSVEYFLVDGMRIQRLLLFAVWQLHCRGRHEW